MTRQRLPDRRGAITLDFEHCYPGAGPRVFTACVGLYPDGRPAEVFVCLVDGTDKSIGVDVHDAAVMISFALQHGADLAEIGAAMLRGSDGRAHGFMGSLCDAVARGFLDGGPTDAPVDPAPAPTTPAAAVAA